MGFCARLDVLVFVAVAIESLSMAQSPRAFAADENYYTYRSEDGSLRLAGSTCDGLFKQKAAMKAWRVQLGEPDVTTPDECVKNSNGFTYSISLKDSVPSFAEKMDRKNSFNDGPNCWNTVLYMNKMIPGIRYVGSQELSFWVDSDLCKMVVPPDHPVPGDVVAIRNPARWRTDFDDIGEEVHAFIYVSDQLGFEKPNFAGERKNDQPYQFNSVKRILKNWTKNPETGDRAPRACQFIGERFPTNPQCKDAWSNVYRCRSMETYLHDVPDPVKARYQALNEKVDRLECHTSELLKSHKLGQRGEVRVASDRSNTEGVFNALSPSHEPTGIAGVEVVGEQDQAQKLAQDVLPVLEKLVAQTLEPLVVKDPLTAEDRQEIFLTESLAHRLESLRVGFNILEAQTKNE